MKNHRLSVTLSITITLKLVKRIDWCCSIGYHVIVHARQFGVVSGEIPGARSHTGHPSYFYEVICSPAADSAYCRGECRGLRLLAGLYLFLVRFGCRLFRYLSPGALGRKKPILGSMGCEAEGAKGNAMGSTQRLQLCVSAGNTACRPFCGG